MLKSGQSHSQARLEKGEGEEQRPHKKKLGSADWADSTQYGPLSREQILLSCN